MRTLITFLVFLFPSLVMADPIEIDYHSAIYKPEMDAVEFLVRFNQVPEFPSTHFFIAVESHDLWYTGIAKEVAILGGKSMRDRGAFELVNWDVVPNGVKINPEPSGAFDYVITDTLFCAFIPSDVFPFDPINAAYTMSVQDPHNPIAISSAYDHVHYAVPEPAMWDLAVAYAITMSICASFYFWIVKPPRRRRW